MNTGRNAGDGWRRTAALSTMHNLLCYDGHDLVLSSTAGSLELAVEILCSDASASVKSAASKLLDQCCFDERSKLAAVNLIPVAAVADILRQSLSRGCQGSAAGSREEANERALLVLVEDTTMSSSRPRTIGSASPPFSAMSHCSMRCATAWAVRSCAINRQPQQRCTTWRLTRRCCRRCIRRVSPQGLPSWCTIPRPHPFAPF